MASTTKARALSAILPAPVASSGPAPAVVAPSDTGQPKPAANIPPYGRRKGWMPKSQAEFGDGGAFPEVLCAQFPLQMGKKGKESTQLVALTTSGDGRANFDALARVGQRADKKVRRAALSLCAVHLTPDRRPAKRAQIYSQLADLKDKDFSAEDLAKPDEEEVAKTTARTKEALEKIVEGKISAAHNPVQAQGKGDGSGPTFIRYTPSASQQAHGPKGGPETRVVRMVEAQKDPMEPPKFKHRRVPAGPGSPPVPVMHSPPRKLTIKDQQDGKIPPCVSSWKNVKGYTVPLDKRLAADGRGLQEVQISDKFAKLSEALYVTERAAREEVEMRNQMQRRLALKEKQAKEEELREMAQRAREERQQLTAGGGMGTGPGGAAWGEGDERVAPPPPPGPPPEGRSGSDDGDDQDDPEALRLAQEREQIRQERKRERDRERRMEAMGNDRRTKMARERERDVSEQIALGQAVPTAAGQETQYDQRLFNQSQGLTSGLADDEAYNIYDKGLFAGTSASAIYKPTRADPGAWAEDEDAVAAKVQQAARFKPDKGFAGAEGGPGARAGSGPVEFEQDAFGLERFLDEAEKEDEEGRPVASDPGSRAAS